MNSLLDTHVLPWLLDDETRCSDAIRSALKKPENDLFVSVVGWGETAVKKSLGNLSLHHSISKVRRKLLRLSFYLIPVKGHYIPYTETLPFHRREPFDRMLIAQAVSDKLTCVSENSAFSIYPVPLQWL